MRLTRPRGPIVSCPSRSLRTEHRRKAALPSDAARVFKLATNLLVAIMESNKPIDKEKEKKHEN